jgi:hypothetical protein|tara:strand:+ start:1250 stop:1618 length:369 start_codon:yes stop_codon:yes gene_type:complete
MSQSSMLPEDGRNNPIPVLYYRNINGTANTFSSTVSTTAVRLGPFSSGTQVLSMYSNADVHFITGNNTITATRSSHFWPSGLYYDFNVFWGGSFNSAESDQYISLITINSSKDANVHISERV